ncbi:MAG: hypothetical protein ABIB71_02200 [Candidatus Woesearchaeota archaeon]
MGVFVRKADVLSVAGACGAAEEGYRDKLNNLSAFDNAKAQ